jgi:nitrogen fixation NifU-like protein
MQLQSMYQEIILDHYRDPHGRGLREPYEGESYQVNPTCGDEVTLRVHLEDEVVRDVSYEGLGCSISQASQSVLHDLVVGKSLDQALAISADFLTLMQSRGDPDIAESLEDSLDDAVAFVGVGRYPARIKCALLGWMALKDAMAKATGGSHE